jgi:6-phosphogluconate dehydrogenase
LAEGGHQTIAHNRSPEPIKEAAGYGAIAASDKPAVIEAFNGGPLLVWIMLPADVIDSELNAWLKIAPKGSIFIDGGNSDFRHDKSRSDITQQAGCQLLDIGTSGGIWGYQNGFCMMVGGHLESFNALKPALDTLSMPEGGYQYFGENGSGHFVKMVHNAIEYGMMESLAEGYRMLKEGPFNDLDLAAAGQVWQKHSVITSWLNELAASALLENPQLDNIDGVVSESGEARWTLEIAKEMNIPMPAIQDAFNVRLASQQGQTSYATKLLAAMRNKFGGHEVNPDR